MELNKNIKCLGERSHNKANEKYVDVIFQYGSDEWKGSVPIFYPRANIDAKTREEKIELLNKVYEEMNPKNYSKWLREQEAFWQTKNAETTQEFFECTKDGKWKCNKCELPTNDNWARRWQTLKEYGYITATKTNVKCEKCGNKSTTQVLLLPVTRGLGSSYETISPKLKKKIIKLLESYDVYEERYNSNLLPDHKFPETRWDHNTPEKNPETMTDDEIKNKFQLLTNQRNQQKREACRNCSQKNKRPYPYGIKFYYQGNEDWDENIPKRSKAAEKGCIGCGWYDLKKWKDELNKLIDQ